MKKTMGGAALRGALGVIACGLAGVGAVRSEVVSRVTALPESATRVNMGDGGRVQVTPAQVKDGVSYNGFSQFDVGKAGLTFLNEGVKARTIVAEVFSAAPSHITGTIDVNGPRANLIFANQNGIRVNGGSFVNFGSVALTTGAVTLRDQLQPSGYVQRLVDVHTKQGEIVIGEQGVSGNLIRLEMIAKSIALQGAVTNEFSSSSALVRMVAGESTAQFDTAASPTDNLTPWVYYEGGKARSTALAVDLNADSKVTSGRIEILVTDQGAGVRNQGQMVASAGDFRLTSTGQLEQVGGKVQAQGQVDIRSRDIALVSRGDETSLLAAGSRVRLQAEGAIRNLGGEISGQQGVGEAEDAYAVVLKAGGGIEHRTPVGAAKTALIFGKEGSVLLDSGQGVDSINARIVSNSDLVIRGAADVRNESVHIAGAGLEDWASHSVFKRRKGYSVDMGELADPANQAYWVAQGNVQVTARNFSNLGGHVFSNQGGIKIEAQESVVTKAHSIGGFEYRQSCFLFVCRRTASSNEALVGGQIMGAESVDIRAGGKILNDAGQVYAGKGMTLEAPEIIARGRPVHTVILRDKGLKALFGDTWARIYATDQGGSYTVQQGRLVLKGLAYQDGGVLQASEGVDGAIEVIRKPSRDAVRIEDHLGIFWW